MDAACDSMTYDAFPGRGEQIRYCIRRSLKIFSYVVFFVWPKSSHDMLTVL